MTAAARGVLAAGLIFAVSTAGHAADGRYVSSGLIVAPDPKPGDICVVTEQRVIQCYGPEEGRAKVCPFVPDLKVGDPR